MRKILTIAIAAAISTGCTGLQAQTVQRTAIAVHDAVEIGMPEWDEYVDRKVSECEAKGLQTRDEGVACLGPAAKADAVADAMVHLKVAQLGVYLGLAEGSPDSARAAAELLRAFREVVAIWTEAGVCSGVCAQVAATLGAR